MPVQFQMSLLCPTRRFCAMTITSLSSMWPAEQTNLAGVTWNWAQAKMARHRFSRVFRQERELWATAVSFFSLPIRSNTEKAASHDSSSRSVRAATADAGSVAGCHCFSWRRDCFPPYAVGCLSRSVAADGADHHAVARTRIRRDRAPGYRPHRSGDERCSEDVGDAFDFLVRAFSRHPDI